MSTAAERREKLRQRNKQAVKTRDQKGLGRKSVIDWGKYDGKKPPSYTLRHGSKESEINVLDFLPWVVTQPWYKSLRTKAGLPTNLDVGDWDYKFEIPVHRNVGENNDVVVCNRLAFGGKCCDCEELSKEYEKDEKEQSEKKIRDLSPSWRCYYNVYDYSEESNPDDEEVLVLEDVSFNNMEAAILAKADIGEETILYSDIEMGKTARIKGREEKFGGNSYVRVLNEDYVEFVDREPYDESIVEKTVSWDSLVHIITYEEHRALRIGIDAEKTSKEEELKSEMGDDVPMHSTSSGGRRRSGKATENKSQQPEEKPNSEWKPGDGCPANLVFGEPDVENKDCKNCPDNIFEACAAEGDSKKEEANAKSEPKTTGRKRTRRSR